MHAGSRVIPGKMAPVYCRHCSFSFNFINTRTSTFYYVLFVNIQYYSFHRIEYSDDINLLLFIQPETSSCLQILWFKSDVVNGLLAV